MIREKEPKKYVGVAVHGDPQIETENKRRALPAQKNGITLIALIITIIVMLILVGVSINILIESDLIGSAKKLAGVCGGVAKYLDIDPTIVRIVWLVLLLAYGLGGIAYLICWILLPKEEAIIP